MANETLKNIAAIAAEKTSLCDWKKEAIAHMASYGVQHCTPRVATEKSIWKDLTDSCQHVMRANGITDVTKYAEYTVRCGVNYKKAKAKELGISDVKSVIVDARTWGEHLSRSVIVKENFQYKTIKGVKTKVAQLEDSFYLNCYPYKYAHAKVVYVDQLGCKIDPSLIETKKTAPTGAFTLKFDNIVGLKYGRMFGEFKYQE